MDTLWLPHLPWTGGCVCATMRRDTNNGILVKNINFQVYEYFVQVNMPIQIFVKLDRVNWNKFSWTLIKIGTGIHYFLNLNSKIVDNHAIVIRNVWQRMVAAIVAASHNKWYTIGKKIFPKLYQAPALGKLQNQIGIFIFPPKRRILRS